MTNDAGRKPEGGPERSPKAGVGGLSERSDLDLERQAAEKLRLLETVNHKASFGLLPPALRALFSTPARLGQCHVR